MRTLGIIFYTAILVIMGLVMIVTAISLSFNEIQPQALKFISDIFVYMQDSVNTRIILALSGVMLIVISFSFAQLILARFQREKTIAFTTSSGEVTVALSAVEDLLRRIAGVIPEIKELKPDVIASKKGIIVNLRVILKSEANIPDLTSRLQDLSRARIQEVLGLEEQIMVKIHIAKIISGDEKDRRRKEFGQEEPQAIPYSGYRRV